MLFDGKKKCGMCRVRFNKGNLWPWRNAAGNVLKICKRCKSSVGGKRRDR